MAMFIPGMMEERTHVSLLTCVLSGRISFLLNIVDVGFRILLPYIIDFTHLYLYTDGKAAQLAEKNAYIILLEASHGKLTSSDLYKGKPISSLIDIALDAIRDLEAEIHRLNYIIWQLKK